MNLRALEQGARIGCKYELSFLLHTSWALPAGGRAEGQQAPSLREALTPASYLPEPQGPTPVCVCVSVCVCICVCVYLCVCGLQVSGLKLRLKRHASSPGCGVAKAFLRGQALLFGGYRDALRHTVRTSTQLQPLHNVNRKLEPEHDHNRAKPHYNLNTF